jgi:hypothetical protein
VRHGQFFLIELRLRLANGRDRRRYFDFPAFPRLSAAVSSRCAA